MLQSEQILKERYQLKQRQVNHVGHQTWVALDLTDPARHLVIIKLLPFSSQVNWTALKLFEREAQVLKHLEHPHIPKYRDYFTINPKDSSELSRFGLVYDYIPGKSLQELLQGGKRFTEAEVKNIASQLLNILIYLHELSPPVIHRDIKPSNIIWDSDKQVYLIDFGTVQDRAKAEGATFTVVGPSGYVPPEQLWGRAIPASDLYALGATLVHLLTGTAPDDLPQQQMRLQFGDRVQLSPRFAHWLGKLTNLASERRFASARTALEALKTVNIASASLPKKFAASNQGITLQVSGSSILLATVQYFLILFILWSTFDSFQSTYSKKIKIAQRDAEHYVNQMNSAQQFHYSITSTLTDKNLRIFPTSGVSSATEMITDNRNATHSYSIRTTAQAAFHYVVARPGRYTFKDPNLMLPLGIPPLWLTKEPLKSYVGGVFVVPASKAKPMAVKDKVTILSIVCEANVPGSIKPAEPRLQNGLPTCSQGTRPKRNMVNSPTLFINSHLAPVQML